MLHDVSPLAQLCVELITLSGDFFAVEFADTDNLKDSDSLDQDNSATDYFIRIIVGGSGCSHIDDDGNKYVMAG